MTGSADKLIESYYSEEASALREASWKAMKIGLAVGLLGFFPFGLLCILMFGSVLGLNPLNAVLSIILALFCAFGTVTLLVTSWCFIARWLFLRAKMMRIINTTMLPKRA